MLSMGVAICFTWEAYPLSDMQQQTLTRFRNASGSLQLFDLYGVHSICIFSGAWLSASPHRIYILSGLKSMALFRSQEPDRIMQHHQTYKAFPHSDWTNDGPGKCLYHTIPPCLATFVMETRILSLVTSFLKSLLTPPRLGPCF